MSDRNTGAWRALLALLVLLPAAPARAWGPLAHQAVVSEAIDTLEAPLKPYFKRHRLEMPTLAPDPDAARPEEGPDRRFAVDRLLPFPFRDLPRHEAEVGRRFEAQAAGLGRLPWLVGESYERLVDAFRSGDKARILAEADTLAALVADLHNPLALTDNADGQKSGQHGLWVRVGTRLPEAMQKRLGLDADAAHYLDDPAGHAFSIVNAAYVWLDNLLYQEDLARRSAAGYGDAYYESLEARVGPLVKARLSEAATDAGSYWTTAWTAAGRPGLR